MNTAAAEWAERVAARNAIETAKARREDSKRTTASAEHEHEAQA